MPDDDTTFRNLILTFICIILIYVAQAIVLFARAEMDTDYISGKFNTDGSINIFSLVNFVFSFALFQEMGVPFPFSVIPLVFMIILYIIMVYLAFKFASDLGKDIPIVSWLFS